MRFDIKRAGATIKAARWLAVPCALLIVVLLSRAINIYKSGSSRVFRSAWIDPFILVCFAVIVLALITFYGSSFSKKSRFRLIIGTCCFIVGLTAVVVMPDFFQVAPAAPGSTKQFTNQSTFAFSRQVFFPNGLRQPYPDDLIALKSAVEGSRGCLQIKADVLGFASAAPYHDDSDNRNKVLANSRADEIAAAIEQMGINAKSQQWDIYDHMRLHTGHSDTDSKSKTRRLKDLEILNRRVDVIFHGLGSCVVTQK